MKFVVYREKKVKSKALKWFSSFLEKLQLLLKPRLIRCLILQGSRLADLHLVNRTGFVGDFLFKLGHLT